MDEASKKLTHAFIGSRLDYCNVGLLWCGIAEGLLTRLQSVQNAAARLATGLGRREYTCPAAASPAASSSTCDVQAGDVGLPLACRNCTRLPVR